MCACLYAFRFILTEIFFLRKLQEIQLIPNSTDLTAEGILTLQVFNQASWQETFLELWLSALRLVQRVETSPC